MGVPERDYATLKQWCGYRAALGWGRPAPEDQIEIATGMAAYRGYLRELVAVKAGEPGDDLTSDLLGIHRENPERLTLDEIASILFSLSFAGHETTTGLIGNTVRRLLEAPERWSGIAADPGLIPAAVEETLRYDPSVPVWRRVTTRPVTLAGVELPAGAKLFLWLAAAGRMRPPSPSRMCSTCTGLPPDATWPSARACITAWARTSGSWKSRSRSPRSPTATPGCGSHRTSSLPSIPTSRSADRRP